MKRSDMVRLITAWCNIHTFKTVDEWSGDFMMTLDEGDRLLKFIEKQGMLPVPYKEVTKENEWEDDNRFPNGGLFLTKDIERTFFKWEPEDNET